MKQYCRYCAYCVVGDVAYCERLYKELDEKKAKHCNNCHYFVLNRIDAFGETDGYKPRIYRSKKMEGQMSLSDFGM